MSTHHRNQLLPRHLFIKRQITCLCLGLGVLLIALFIGIAGYHWLGELDWVDSLLNASMILGGMGPVNQLHTNAAKIFASIYALLSGIVLIGVMAIILGPSVHRVLHMFHLDEKDLQ